MVARRSTSMGPLAETFREYPTSFRQQTSRDAAEDGNTCLSRSPEAFLNATSGKFWDHAGHPHTHLQASIKRHLSENIASHRIIKFGKLEQLLEVGVAMPRVVSKVAKGLRRCRCSRGLRATPRENPPPGVMRRWGRACRTRAAQVI